MRVPMEVSGCLKGDGARPHAYGSHCGRDANACAFLSFGRGDWD